MWSTNVKKSAVKFNLLAYKREEQSKVWIENGIINSFQLSFKRETFFHPRERFINFDSMNWNSCSVSSSRNSKVVKLRFMQTCRIYINYTCIKSIRIYYKHAVINHKCLLSICNLVIFTHNYTIGMIAAAVLQSSCQI